MIIACVIQIKYQIFIWFDDLGTRCLLQTVDLKKIIDRLEFFLNVSMN